MKYTNNRHKSPPSPFSIYPHTKMPSLSLSLSLAHSLTHTQTVGLRDGRWQDRDAGVFATRTQAVEAAISREGAGP